MTKANGSVTARCYCGASVLSFGADPLCVTYCHCSDCRRWTGAPLPAFAAFDETALTEMPPSGQRASHTPGVERWTCRACGSPLAARFDYLPGQIYVPLGVIDQAHGLPPQSHCHDGSRLPWLHLDDDLPRAEGSNRAALSDAGKPDD